MNRHQLETSLSINQSSKLIETSILHFFKNKRNYLEMKNKFRYLVGASRFPNVMFLNEMINFFRHYFDLTHNKFESAKGNTSFQLVFTGNTIWRRLTSLFGFSFWPIGAKQSKKIELSNSRPRLSDSVIFFHSMNTFKLRMTTVFVFTRSMSRVET